MPHETIHSGHFMTSNPHTETPIDDEDEDVEVDVVDEEEKPGLKRKESVATDEKPVTFYKFGKEKTQSFAIDASLNKLNKCIKVAYNKMTTPKWKDFKGLRLHWKQRIRLNNVIWRAYHMEFGRPLLTKKKSPYCFFAVPDDDSTHVKIEGTVLEGMYWKRRVEAVCAQYKKWRHFNRPKGHAHHLEGHKRSMLMLSKPTISSSKSLYLDSFGERKKKEPLPMRSQTPKNTSTEYFDIDDLENEFTDTLFESLNAPYMFPNPKEIGNSGNADFMQPGLLSLQPSLEEIMASLINDDDDSSLSFLDLAPPGTSHSQFNVPRSLSPLRPSSSSTSSQQHRPPPVAAKSVQPQQQQQQQPTIRRAPLPPAKRIAAAYDQQQQLLQQQQAAAAAAQQQQQQLQHQQRVFSSKEYQAAHMLVDYSNQSPARPATGSSSLQQQQRQQAAAAANVPLQPTRQSSIGSPMMLSQPQYTSATQYGGGGTAAQDYYRALIGAPLSVPEWKASPMSASPLMGSSSSSGGGTGLLSGLGGLGGGGGGGGQTPANSFLVTGGDVIPANMDYMPQFLSAAAAAGSTRSPSASLMMQAAATYTRGLHGIPGISSAASSTSIGSPASTSAFSNPSRWWDQLQQQQPSTSTAASPAAASPLTAASAAASPAATAAAAATLLTRSHSHLGHGHGQSPSSSSTAAAYCSGFVDPHGLVPSPGSGRLQRNAAAAASAASLPRDTLSERLGSRSVLVDAGAARRLGAGGGSAAGATLVSTQQQPQSAPAETTENPWDRDDPCSSRRMLFPKEEREDRQSTSQEMMKEEEEELDAVAASGSGGGAAHPVRPPTAVGGKRGTKQVPADSTLHPTERKRILHLHAEQSRRMALKDGFDQLMEIVPDVHSGGIKPTNAVVLAKAADHIKAMLLQKEQKAQRIADMKETIRALNERISSLQSSLPSSSRRDQASSSLDQRSAIEQFFERYTKERTKEDWRFWLMARLFKPIVANYAAAVHDDPADKEEVAQSAAAWMQDEWRVSKLRPLSSEVLVYLATNTRVLADPASLQAHIEQQVNAK
uniref:BHLH domain-containing protein n=1 Tax=Pristionchus pacificus TaxID=54126 RepID=A0A8R1UH17_PRIPA